MPRPVLVIADLHLDRSRPAATQTFLRFLEEEAPQAEAVYILGDLFEAWIGDDSVAADDPTLLALRAAATTTSIHVMHGNRDFLLGADFATASGVNLLPDPSVVTIHGERVLMMHGDSLCTGDAEYMQFRAMVRDPAWQRQFLALPIEERLDQARQARGASTKRNQQLDEAIMDVTPEAVDTAMRDHGVRWLIHGHTHRPGIHDVKTASGTGKRFVVGDWFDQGSVLRCHSDRWTLETLPHEA
ncbi:UDP-2,3-diacylglucosamine diphosphatase [Halorhodospira halophila]|uniref:UDP-2,3-diacylglucosamine hydrolase n=1 Tax=Halorhodospira halophila (strain DSM 244 / SL1) TaxID=349124 RepID=A1WT91_HALHL|nr:UDP-2,3-diacylglucosamine diphosphatase [Halorhodospira halophila]ABM60903.1 UDP-2,3-diacylglucosamine hydrolase [Halorhodospira halophila SL1]MBK1728561.1 UDP-2,3-diacylglucosamine diphosphatase [Halorhodospira halophila]